MIYIIFHTRRPNTQENVTYLLGFYVSADVHQKRVFHIAPFRSTCHVLKIFWRLEVRKHVPKLNKCKILIFVGSILQKYQFEVPKFIYKLMSHISQ